MTDETKLRDLEESLRAFSKDQPMALSQVDAEMLMQEAYKLVNRSSAATPEDLAIAERILYRLNQVPGNIRPKTITLSNDKESDTVSWETILEQLTVYLNQFQYIKLTNPFFISASRFMAFVRFLDFMSVFYPFEEKHYSDVLYSLFELPKDIFETLVSLLPELDITLFSSDAAFIEYDNALSKPISLVLEELNKKFLGINKKIISIYRSIIDFIAKLKPLVNSQSLAQVNIDGVLEAIAAIEFLFIKNDAYFLLATVVHEQYGVLFPEILELITGKSPSQYAKAQLYLADYYFTLDVTLDVKDSKEIMLEQRISNLLKAAGYCERGYQTGIDTEGTLTLWKQVVNAYWRTMEDNIGRVADWTDLDPAITTLVDLIEGTKDSFREWLVGQRQLRVLEVTVKSQNQIIVEQNAELEWLRNEVKQLKSEGHSHETTDALTQLSLVCTAKPSPPADIGVKKEEDSTPTSSTFPQSKME